MDAIEKLNKLVDAYLPKAEKGDIDATNIVLRALELQAKIRCGAFG